MTDVKSRNRLWRTDALVEPMLGSPIDEAYWDTNNPANVAIRSAAKMRDAHLAIYLDMFHLHEAAEFLHPIPWDHQIPHEYHLVRGGDNLGASLPSRLRDGLGFL